LLVFPLDRLAMNLDERYRPAGDFIIEDADLAREAEMACIARYLAAMTAAPEPPCQET
jgi:hypothetical protein